MERARRMGRALGHTWGPMWAGVSAGEWGVVSLLVGASVWGSWWVLEMETQLAAGLACM